MADVVVQAQSTLFSRSGATYQKRGYLMPTALWDRITNGYANSAIGLTISEAEQTALYALLTQNSQIIPGGLTLYNVQALDPTLFPGAADLQALYEIDPFSTEYETETDDLYDRVFAIARAVAQSGPTNVRGGTARQGFELAELDTLMSINRFKEIWQNQLAMAQIVLQAIQVANQAETQRYDLQLRAQQLQAGTEQGRVVQTLSAAEQLNRDRDTHIRTLAAGGEFQSLPNMSTEESYQGQGFQGGVNTAFGMTAWR